MPELRYANLADFAANIPNQIQVTYGVATYHLRTFEVGTFLQDDWRVTQRLVVNAGLRWDYFSPASEDDNRIFNRRGPFGLGAFLPDGKSWNENTRDFSPRLSAAYRTNDRGTRVIRAGFGVFHSPHVLLGGPIGIVRTSLEQPTRANFTRQDVLSYGSLLKFPVSNELTAPIASAVDSGLAINTNYPDPYSLQWTAGIEQQIARNWLFETSYVGNRGVHLTMIRAMNQPDRVTGLRPVQNLGTFNFYDSSESSNYESWQTSLSKRFSKAYLLNLHYTWARSFSYTQEADLISPLAIQNSFDARSDYGPSIADIHHRFTGDFVFDIMSAGWFQRARPWMRAALGWQIGGIFTAQSGSPVNVIQTSGLDGSRPDATGVDPLLGEYRDTLLYLNLAAFAAVPVNKSSGLTARPGNVGRNAVHGPGLWNVDLNITKTFPVYERATFRISADALNAFNHTNYADPATDLTSALFGRITGSRGARVIQFTARLTF